MAVTPSPQEGLPSDHLAYVVSDLVEELALRPILRPSGGVTRGTAPSHPRVRVKVLLYAYAGGGAASRQMARAREADVAFRGRAANQRPDVRPLSAFRTQPLAALTALCVPGLRRGPRAGWVKRGPLALDGTKLQTQASPHKALSDDRRVTEEPRVQAEVEALLQQTEAAEAREAATSGPERRGDELPVAWARRAQRIETIRAAKAVLEQEAQTTAELAPRGPSRRPAPPGPTPAPRPVPAPKAQRNCTDPERRLMPASGATGRGIHGDHCPGRRGCDHPDQHGH